MRIHTHLNHVIRVPLDELPEGVAKDLMDALTIPNRAKVEAQKQHQWGWETMPDWLDLWSIDDVENLCMPRGFLGDYMAGMKVLGHEVVFSDHRSFKAMLRVGLKPTPKSWQEPAVQKIIDREQGIYKAPSGSGKTVAVLIAIQRLGCKSLVIVNTKDILWQWKKRVAEHLGEDYPVGQIGGNVFEVSPYITIATAQTLHSRYDKLVADGFFDQFSFVCLDECHHAQAETYGRVVNRFNARYRIGVSATPDKTGDFALATAVLGPIFHETRPEDCDNLMRPTVIRVTTDFFYAFRGTKSARERSNYAQMITAMVRDPDRNQLIVSKIMENKGHHQLVVSKRLEHLATLESMLLAEGLQDPIVTITGQDDDEARLYAKQLSESEPCVLLSTLADEAMDIPRLDRLHLVFPQKNPGLVTQQVGRVERDHGDKQQALIYDYADLKVGPLQNQWRVRRREVYTPRGYRVEMGSQIPLV